MNKLNVFYDRFPFSWKTIRGAAKNISCIPLLLKWAGQRVTRGYAECDIWNFDSFLADLIPAGMRALTHGIGYPSGFESSEEWHSWLNETADMFDKGFGDDWTSESPADRSLRKAVARKALERFIDRFEDLWD